MNNFITVSIILLIGAFQLYFLIKGLKLIKSFKSIFSMHQSVDKVTLYIPEEDLQKLTSDTILKNWNQYTNRPLGGLSQESQDINSDDLDDYVIDEEVYVSK